MAAAVVMRKTRAAKRVPMLLNVFAGRTPSTEQTSDVPVQTVFVYNVTGTRPIGGRLVSHEPPSSTQRPIVPECDGRLVEFCPFGRVLFIIPNQFPGPVKCSRPPPLNPSMASFSTIKHFLAPSPTPFYSVPA